MILLMNLFISDFVIFFRNNRIFFIRRIWFFSRFLIFYVLFLFVLDFFYFNFCFFDLNFFFNKFNFIKNLFLFWCKSSRVLPLLLCLLLDILDKFIFFRFFLILEASKFFFIRKDNSFKVRLKHVPISLILFNFISIILWVDFKYSFLERFIIILYSSNNNSKQFYLVHDNSLSF